MSEAGHELQEEEAAAARLRRQIVGCRHCPRLVEHRETVARQRRRAYEHDVYWGAPVPGFGPPSARLLIIGLAPGAHGANRTGRMFTGDRSGDWLYGTLHEYGFASQATAAHRGDGLRLADCYITAVCRCVPPQNRPTAAERNHCRPYLERELALLARLTCVVVLGRVAYNSYLRIRRDGGGLWPDEAPRKPDFAHGRRYTYPSAPRTLIASYHPSQQNTFTGRLSQAMFRRVFASARSCLDGSTPSPSAAGSPG